MTLKGCLTTALMAAALGFSATAGAQTLRIGLQDDPDLLDPDRARTFVGRIVFASLCDKLIDLSPEATFVPQLATEWSWSDDSTVLTMKLREDVVFHDGTPFNAEAAVYNLDRSLNLPGSTRRSEISAITGLDAVDEYTIEITLAEPFAPLLAALSDRAGMMISPTAAEAAGEDFPLNPVCSGPFKFVERVSLDRIVLERFEDYWNADAIHFDRVVYRPIADTTVRLANLQAGDLDIIERVAATDIPIVEGDPNLTLERATSLGYQGLTVNVGNGPRSENPLGQDPRVREALELAIDRNIINQVAFDGALIAGNQPVPPGSPYYIDSLPPAGRDVERARALLEEAGAAGLAIDLMIANNPEQMRVAEIIQALAAEAGFAITIDATEFATALDRQSNGDFQAFLIGWSGRADPDGNIHTFTACNGGLNDGGYCNEEVDGYLADARQTTDEEARYAAYEKAAEIYLTERPRIFLYHRVWFTGVSNKVEGFQPYPDGMIRLENVRFAE